ncbi:hypothetical protein [Haloferula sp. BvORR071]|uniref:hypothetical protein n=1 Tax=Haloferula sp. BvORR071 TaxID=1396141 RepID=UPI00054DC150|nr:hypothetical protein [Haloferula sp. BvORR071]
MKTAPFLLVLSSGILIGGIGGWSLRSTAEEPEPPAASGHAAAKPEKTARRDTPQNPALQAELRALKDPSAPKGTVDFREWSLPDLRILATAFLEQSDPVEGLPPVMRMSLDALLITMARKDRDATFAWIDANLPSQRAKLYCAIIADSMRNASIRERLEFLKGRNFTTSEISGFAREELSKLGLRDKTMDTETGLYLLGNLGPCKSMPTLCTTNFASDFDFARFATAVLEKAKSDEGKFPDIFPSNFLQDWAKTSPQAAIDFYFSHCVGKGALELPIEQLLTSVKSGIPAKEYATWLGETISQQVSAEKPDPSMIRRMIYSELANPALLGAALDAIDDRGARTKLLYDTMFAAAESSFFSSDGANTLRGTLALFQDPAERLDQAGRYAREVAQRNGDRDQAKLIDNLCTQLANLGHSESEIRGIRAAAFP